MRYQCQRVCDVHHQLVCMLWVKEHSHFLLFVAPEPPQMFQITSATTINISFSWQTPAVLNGILTGYQLTCQPVPLAGIPSPPILSSGPSVNTALFPNLSPGLRYNCSIVARNSAGSSDPVYTVGTTTETGIHDMVHYVAMQLDIVSSIPSPQ